MKLQAENISFSYGKTDVLKNIDAVLSAGELVSIIGPNGAGKSTLLKCLIKLLKARGTIHINERDIRKMTIKEIALYTSYVPQTIDGTFPSTVYEIIMLGRRPHVKWSATDADNTAVSEAISFLGLTELASRHFSQLSGGEKQKVLIARALAQEPDIIMLDEPTSNLDIKHQLEVLELLRVIIREKGIAALMISHDLNLAARFSDKIIILNSGEVFDYGKPEEVLTAENIRRVYRVDVEIMKGAFGIHIIPVTSADSLTGINTKEGIMAD